MLLFWTALDCLPDQNGNINKTKQKIQRGRKIVGTLLLLLLLLVVVFS